MNPLPRINAHDLARVLEMLGFTCVRSKGSHFAYRHPDGRATLVPYHGLKPLHSGFIKEVLRQIEVSDEVYRNLVKRL